MNVLTLRECHCDHCSFITGNAMKCTTKFEDHVSASIRENAIMLVDHIKYTTVAMHDMSIHTTFSIEMKGLKLNFYHQGHCYS